MSEQGLFLLKILFLCSFEKFVCKNVVLSCVKVKILHFLKIFILFAKKKKYFGKVQHFFARV